MGPILDLNPFFIDCIVEVSFLWLSLPVYLGSLKSFIFEIVQSGPYYSFLCFFSLLLKELTFIFHLLSLQLLLCSVTALKSSPVHRPLCRLYLSRVVRKPAFCICENKDADQLCGNREADQRLCFRYIDSTIHLLPKYARKFPASNYLL